MGTTLPKMRTPQNAIAELKKTDPDTEFTVRALRSLIHSGDIPSVRVGTKFLVNMETLYDYLYKGITPEKK